MFRRFIFILFLLVLIPKASAAVGATCNYALNPMFCGQDSNCGPLERCVCVEGECEHYIESATGKFVATGRCRVVSDIPCEMSGSHFGCSGSLPAPEGKEWKPVLTTSYFRLGDNNGGNLYCTEFGLSHGCWSFGQIPTQHYTPYYTCALEDTTTGCEACGELNCYNIYDGSGYTKGCFSDPKESCTDLLANESTYANLCLKNSPCGSPGVCAKTFFNVLGWYAHGSYCAPAYNTYNTSKNTSCCTEYNGVSPIRDAKVCGKNILKPEITSEPLYYTCCGADSMCVDAADNTAGNSSANMPDEGTCLTCVAAAATPGLLEGTPCNPSVNNGVEGFDNCCNSDYVCLDKGSGPKCTIKDPEYLYDWCSEEGGFLQPGAICKYKDSTDDFCDESHCPIKRGSAVSETDAQGNERCLSYTSAADECTYLGAGCGCPSGMFCNDGKCTSESCISPTDPNDCSLTDDNCCNSGGSDYTCRTVGSRNKCISTTCAGVTAGTVSCNSSTFARTCCTGNTPYCSDSTGECVTSLECTDLTEGECCGVGRKCESGSCAPTTGDECIASNEPLLPAPGYLGPKIEIPKLFSALGAILYPAGIGIGLFFVVKAGYQLMMSEGNPDAVKDAQETITAAILGIVFIILSASILRVIISSLLG